ncbi:hypothetical protein PVAP13_9KG272591 [Panicum virgatum]|uniref:Uncharacterized protein n=1 Tax=Panicum virgatum TaxID=38727 RepID=A0A8T0NNQ3_PANVG|nr:hypothetical protein PVAP13_9KG272591 [Panicum virgatum]
MFRRETLLWINALNEASTPLSKSTMSNSNSCNCSSSHATLFFWNALDTRDHLLAHGVANSQSPSTGAAILTTLHASMSEATLLLIFLNCFCAFLARRAWD